MPIFIERFFRVTDPSRLTYADFVNFHSQQIEEHQNLEYKPRGLLLRKDNTVVTSNNPRDMVGYTALARSVASFANAEGGLLVLGVREKPERYKGNIVKIRPGNVTPLPLSVTREAIEANLLSKIQYPVDGVTVVPLRRTPRSKGFVYLIDVPQSVRAPHRVNELLYFQRMNFSTQEMRHYQIADLFGRRRSPDLGVRIIESPTNDGHDSSLRINVSIINSGRAVAKFVTCICQIVGDRYRIFRSSWNVGNNGISCQWQTRSDHVVYPEVATDAGEIVFVQNDGQQLGNFVLRFSLFAEDMPARTLEFKVNESAP
jgi:hypothetical protein